MNEKKTASINWNRWNDWKRMPGVEDIHQQKRGHELSSQIKNTVIMCQFSNNSREYMGERKKNTKVASLLWYFPNWIHVRLCVQAVIYNSPLFFLHCFRHLNDYGWNLTKKQVYWITICYDFVVRSFVRSFGPLCLFPVCWLFVNTSLHSTFHQNQYEIQLRKKYQSNANFNSVLQTWVVCVHQNPLSCFSVLRSFVHSHTHTHTLLPIRLSFSAMVFHLNRLSSLEIFLNR